MYLVCQFESIYDFQNISFETFQELIEYLTNFIHNMSYDDATTLEDTTRMTEEVTPITIEKRNFCFTHHYPMGRTDFLINTIEPNM